MKTITKGQVKQIAIELNKSFELKAHGNSHYEIIDRKTGISSNMNNIGWRPSYDFTCRIKMLASKAIDGTTHYFCDPNADQTEKNERQAYLFKIKDAIVTMLCGFDFEVYKAKSA